MEDNNSKQQDVIDLGKIVRTLLSKKKLFGIVLAITFVISSILILCVPRTYTCSVKLAPESEGATTGNSLSSLASSFGFDIGDIQSSDAIFPLLYPELFESNDFVVSLFGIKVKSIDGQINTTYYNYLDKYQKKTIWEIPFMWIRSQVGQLMEKTSPVDSIKKRDSFDSFLLSKRQTTIAEQIKNSIVCSIDKKTSVVTITVTDQDPLICATLADSAKVKLQQFIINYRTNKARVDVDHYKELMDKAQDEYDIAVQRYSAYSDTHKDIILQAYISERDKLENDMSLKYNTYTAMKTQLEAANAKLQEKMPAFTVLQGATVPIKATGPKRMIFVIGMLFLAAICTSLYIFKNQLLSPFK